jgi:hypothetical protein
VCEAPSNDCDHDVAVAPYETPTAAAVPSASKDIALVVDTWFDTVSLAEHAKVLVEVVHPVAAKSVHALVAARTGRWVAALHSNP